MTGTSRSGAGRTTSGRTDPALLVAIDAIYRSILEPGRLDDAVARGADAVLDACGLATVVTSVDGRLLWANTMGETLLREGSLRARCDMTTLALVDADAEAALRVALAGVRGGNRHPVEFPLHSDAPLETGWCVTIPLPATGNDRHAVPAALALVVQRGDRRVPIDPGRLEQRLGLAPAEADVVSGLMQGEDLPAIAMRRGCTVATIRSYLKSARRKLHCHSQAQLVSAGWRAIALVPDLGNTAEGE